jgi:hypothetical protein
LVKKGKGSRFESSFSQNYTIWRNQELSEVVTPKSAIVQQKRTRTDNEEEL